MTWPAYLELWRSGELELRAERALAELRSRSRRPPGSSIHDLVDVGPGGSCRVCPRDCDVNRLADATGICKVGRRARVSSWFAHFGEEDCLRGWNGSGTIFFSWCNLKCVFCQNWETSNEGAGEERLATPSPMRFLS